MKALTVSLFLAMSGVASAAFTSTGYTNGCFGPGCIIIEKSSPQGASLAGSLLFSNSLFASTVAGTTIDLNGAATFPPAQGTGNLGNVFLGTNTAVYTGSSFSLHIRFNDPAFTSVLFTAALTGSVSEGVGSVLFNFNNAPVLMTHANGSFTVAVDDLIVTANGNETAIVGHLVQIADTSNIPEPSTWLMVSTAALFLIGSRLTRRLNS